MMVKNTPDKDDIAVDLYGVLCCEIDMFQWTIDVVLTMCLIRPNI